MMKLPERYGNIPTTQERIVKFGGINLMATPAEGTFTNKNGFAEFASAMNMSSDEYPAAKPRGARRKRTALPWSWDSIVLRGYRCISSTVCAIENNGLFVLAELERAEGGVFVRDGYCSAFWEGVDIFSLAVNEGDALRSELSAMFPASNVSARSVVRNGAYILILPERYIFNCKKASEYIASIDSGGERPSFGEILCRVEHKIESDADGNIIGVTGGALLKVAPCYDDMSVVGAVAPFNTIAGGSSFKLPLSKSQFQSVISGGYSAGTYFAAVDDNGIIRFCKLNKQSANADARREYQKNITLRFEATTGEIGGGFSVGDRMRVRDFDVLNTGGKKNLPGFSCNVVEVGAEYVTVVTSDISYYTLETLCEFWGSDINNTPMIIARACTLERAMPQMTVMCEWNNRLWGAGGDDNNTIYANALGDPLEWELFEGTASDSYYASVGTSDRWVGAVTYDDHAYFFKENECYKLYGSYPAEFQYSKLDLGTVSGRSLAVVGGALFFLRRDGIYYTTGSAAVKVSDALGDALFYNSSDGTECVGFEYDGKYYITCKRGTGVNEPWHLYVYDVALRLWHEESMPGGVVYSAFRRLGNIMLVTDDTRYCTIIGREKINLPDYADPDGTVFWSFETGELGGSDGNYKYISKIQICAGIAPGASFTVLAKGTDGEWYKLGESPRVRYENEVRRAVNLYLRPRRCTRLCLRFEGEGDTVIYSIAISRQGSSEYGNEY